MKTAIAIPIRNGINMSISKKGKSSAIGFGLNVRAPCWAKIAPKAAVVQSFPAAIYTSAQNLPNEHLDSSIAFPLIKRGERLSEHARRRLAPTGGTKLD
jgi:hypothetical protein